MVQRQLEQKDKVLTFFGEIKDATVEMDLSKLDYISSKALRIMVAFHQSVLKNGGSFSILQVTDAVREVFEMTGLAASLLAE